MDRGVHGVAESDTTERLTHNTHTHTHTHTKPLISCVILAKSLHYNTLTLGDLEIITDKMITIKFIVFVSNCMPRILSSGTKEQGTVLQAAGLGCGGRRKGNMVSGDI